MLRSIDEVTHLLQCTSGGGDDPSPSDGSGRATTDIFDPLTSSWSSRPTMNDRRWYPTATLLPSGDNLNLLGSIYDSFDTNEIPDVTTNHATGIRSLTGVASATLYYNYPRTVIAPNGKPFIVGMERTSHYLDTSGTGAYTTGPASIFGTRIYGPAVSYDPGKIPIAGGGTNDDGATPTNPVSPRWHRLWSSSAA
jgi:galactose oxidase